MGAGLFGCFFRLPTVVHLWRPSFSIMRPPFADAADAADAAGNVKVGHGGSESLGTAPPRLRPCGVDALVAAEMDEARRLAKMFTRAEQVFASWSY